MIRKIYPGLLYFFVAILLIANVLTLFLLWKTGRPFHHDKTVLVPGQGPQQFLIQELSMNKSQEEAYQKLFEAQQQQRKLLHDSTRKAKDLFFDLLSNSSMSDSEILTAGNRSAYFMQQEDLLTFKHFRDVRALLSDSQKNKFDNIIKDVLRQMAPPTGDRRGGPPPKRQGEMPQNLPPPQ